MPKRVLLAGLFHETHTFLDGATPLVDFDRREGAELLAAAGDGSPLGGVVQLGREGGWTLLPAIDLRATPSALVEDEVVECFWRGVEAVCRRELPGGIDGVYLVLHGAMASRSYPDVEGEVLRRLQVLLDQFGAAADSVPVCGVLDLHANATQAMADFCHALVAYRENPHVDAEESAIRAALLLDRLMTTGERPVTVWERPPVMWPPTGVATADEPMRSLEAMARELESRHEELLAVNVLAGFSFADTPDTGVSFSAATLGDPAEARARLRRLCDWTWEHRAQGNVVDPAIEDRMPDVLTAAQRRGPVLIVEPADNIGGGAPGDGTGVLKALIEHRVENAAVVVNDADAVRDCRRAVVGERLRLSIGGRQSRITAGPADVEVELLSLSDGKFELEDRHSHLASMCGVRVDMGDCAVVRHRHAANAGGSGIRILLTSRKTPPFDLGQLRSQGIVPEQLAVIGVKAAVAHRRAYDPIATASFTVDTPGPCSSNLKLFPFEKLNRPVFPLD